MKLIASNPIATETHGSHAGHTGHTSVAPQCRTHRPMALVSADVRRNMIAETAYYLAKRRGFAPGYELDDWLADETEVDTALTIGVQPASD